MKWITRSHIHVDRVACPWLILRFVDNQAEFLFVPASQVKTIAADTGAVPFDAPDVELASIKTRLRADWKRLLSVTAYAILR